MPALDWQFAIVTLFAAGALLVLVRRFMPAKVRVRGGKGDPSCAHCASNEQNRKTNMSSDVKTNSNLPSPDVSKLPVMF